MAEGKVEVGADAVRRLLCAGANPTVVFNDFRGNLVPFGRVTLSSFCQLVQGKAKRKNLLRLLRNLIYHPIYPNFILALLKASFGFISTE